MLYPMYLIGTSSLSFNYILYKGPVHLVSFLFNIVVCGIMPSIFPSFVFAHYQRLLFSTRQVAWLMEISLV